MNFQTRLGEILGPFHANGDGYLLCEAPDEPCICKVAGVQQQITELFLEIIGEDEQEIVHNLLPGMPYIEKRETNQLKSELRKAIND